MSDLQVIEATLRRAGRRRRWERALRGLCLGLLIGELLLLLTFGVYKLAPIPFSAVIWAGIAGGIAALLGLIIGGWRAVPVAEMARLVDRQEKLQERLSTALEFGASSNTGVWRDLVVADAVAHAQQLDPRRLVRIHIPRFSRWIVLCLTLAIGLGFVPEYRSKAYLQKQTDAKVVQEAGRQLTELTKHNLENRKPVLETTEKAMESVKELGNELAMQPISRSAALKDLANVTDKLKDQLNDMAKDPALKRLEQAARSSSGSTSPEVARLQKQIEDLQKQMGTPTGTPEDMEKMQQALQKLQEAAKAAASQNGGMSPSDKQKLSESLSALSRQSQNLGLQMPNIDQAIQALAASQTDLFLKDLQASVNDLQKDKEMAKSLQQMQQQMDKMGKDLAEQLKNGQPETAQSTLEKMVQQLQSANLTPEQLQKLLAEVSNAVKPGSQYGKVGDLLKQASQQLGQGQKAQGAQSLADAAKELSNLMQQMGDAQALSAELDALKQASQCVGTGQNWGQCQNPNPRGGKGGKPGSGVGTWADEDSGWGYSPPAADRWDNSGVVRPDTTPKGQTDRGDSPVNDSFVPTKVKGQFSPGGQMPSITLKGVSIKGQSKVAYEEEAVAAQADAQSALSQEKVPRAYQGAVRDYFDDLKK